MGLLSSVGDYLQGGLLPDPSNYGGLIDPSGIAAQDSFAGPVPPLADQSQTFGGLLGPDAQAAGAQPSIGDSTLAQRMAQFGGAAPSQPAQGALSPLPAPFTPFAGAGQGQPPTGFKPMPGLLPALGGRYG